MNYSWTIMEWNLNSKLFAEKTKKKSRWYTFLAHPAVSVPAAIYIEPCVLQFALNLTANT